MASKTVDFAKATDKSAKKPETRGVKKGSPGHNKTGKGLPIDREPMTDERRELISRLVTETIRTYQMPRVKSDEELAQRLADYFQHCAVTGERPTVEQMAQCTGYSLGTVYDWETGKNRGFSSDTSHIVKKAKEFLRVFDAKMVAEGALNPVVYIFRAKNYYGMKDQQDIVVAPSNPMGPDPDAGKLAADYLAQLPDADYPTMEEAKD